MPSGGRSFHSISVCVKCFDVSHNDVDVVYDVVGCDGTATNAITEGTDIKSDTQ